MKIKSYLINAEVATGGVLWKKLFLKISQISQKNACDGVSFFADPQAYNFIKKKL